MVALRFAPSPHSTKLAGLIPVPWLVWSLQVVPVTAWLHSGFFGFLPQSIKEANWN